MYMYHKIEEFFPIFFTFSIIVMFIWPINSAYANQQKNHICKTDDRICILNQIESKAEKIENQSWKDQTYRELAKTYAFEKQFEQAINIIDLIQTPDTKAMTIRGVGMTIATQNHTQESYDRIFTQLRTKVEKIEHPPSYAIALTYIAMAQAFAGDNDGAWKTASDMDNTSLRNKAYAETAEIQAEKKDYSAAKTSIEKIQSQSFRNKAYSIISKILADNAEYDDAYHAARSITNAYKQTQSLQYILDAQKPRDVKH